MQNRDDNVTETPMNNKKQYMIKLTLLGDGAVGKTSIRQRYLGKGFKTELLPTLGADFATIEKVIGDNHIKFQIWDLGGQTQYKHVRPRFYKGCFGALLIFDVTRRESFMNLSNWLEELYTNNGKGTVPVIILANKVDLEEQKSVTLEELKEFTDKLSEQTMKKNIKNFYLETSAKTGLNIDKAFEIVADYIIKKFTEE